jgi:hypothetical protein
MDLRRPRNLRTVILVSPHFPPSSLAGVHRARHLAKHLPAHGWWPIVLRVDEAQYEETADPALAALVPGDVEQIRVGAAPASMARRFGIGDVGLRGLWPLRRALAEIAARRDPKAVLITGSPFYPMLLSSFIRRRLDLPAVLDFQDPWVSAESASRSVWSKGGVAHRLAVVLEPQAVRGAAFITSVSERQNDELAQRNPGWPRELMAAIPIGGDPEDFAALRAAPPAPRLDPKFVNLSYVGAVLPRAQPLVRVLFEALGDLRRSEPRVAERLRLQFVGSSNNPSGHADSRVRALAQELGVGDLVVETPQRVAYLEALAVLAQSQGLLLIGSDEPHYTASKIYAALMSGVPYLSLYHSASSAHQILVRAGGGVAVDFSDSVELAARRPVLADALRRLVCAPEPFGRADPAAYEPYSAHNVARRFAHVLDRLAA